MDQLQRYVVEVSRIERALMKLEDRNSVVGEREKGVGGNTHRAD